MQRIAKIDAATAPARTAELLAAVKQKMGGVPNILATMAASPAALAGYLGLSGALGEGRLDARMRERIALAVAGANRCDYCASAHSAIGSMVGLSKAEIEASLTGRAEDADAGIMLGLVTRIVQQGGLVSDADLAAVRAAGHDDETIVEIVANVALNIFTNYFNHIAGTDIDFPLVSTDSVAA